MSVILEDEKITEWINRLVRRVGAEKVARYTHTKPQIVRFWSCGERPSPLQQTVWLLALAKHTDPKLYDEAVEILAQSILPSFETLSKAKRLILKILESVLDDYEIDEGERLELEREFKKLVGGKR